MSLKHGLLGLLNYGEMSGYELNKAFKESLHFFWQAQTSQIYRELNAMEKSGWLTSNIVFQADKPNKKMYCLTDTGKAELETWLFQNSFDNEFQVRSIFLMKLFFSGIKNTEENIAMFKAYREKCIEELEDLKRTNNIIEHYEQKVEEKQAAVYWGLTARFGEIHLKACLDFADEAIKTLEALL
jgi:PadR family transcriptional regulator AphA